MKQHTHLLKHRACLSCASVLSYLLAACIFLPGCATIISGTRQKVAFTSVPSGAKVQVNGLDRGTTPATIKLKRSYNAPTITVSADGYQPRIFQPETHFNPVTLVGIFFPALIGFDLLDGAIWKYNPKKYDIELQRK